MRLFEKRNYKESPKVIDKLYTWQTNTNYEKEKKFSFLILISFLFMLLCGIYFISSNNSEIKIKIEKTTEEIPIFNPPKKVSLEDRIINKSINHSIDYVLVLSIIKHESNFNIKAKGALDDRGLMQVRLINMTEKEKKRPYDIDNNLTAGLRYLKLCKNKYKTDIKQSISCYNMGLNGNYNSNYVRAVCYNYLNYHNTYKTNKSIYQQCKKTI